MASNFVSPKFFNLLNSSSMSHISLLVLLMMRVMITMMVMLIMLAIKIMNQSIRGSRGDHSGSIFGVLDPFRGL